MQHTLALFLTLKPFFPFRSNILLLDKKYLSLAGLVGSAILIVYMPSLSEKSRRTIYISIVETSPERPSVFDREKARVQAHQRALLSG